MDTERGQVGTACQCFDHANATPFPPDLFVNSRITILSGLFFQKNIKTCHTHMHEMSGLQGKGTKPLHFTGQERLSIVSCFNSTFSKFLIQSQQGHTGCYVSIKMMCCSLHQILTQLKTNGNFGPKHRMKDNLCIEQFQSSEPWITFSMEHCGSCGGFWWTNYDILCQ